MVEKQLSQAQNEMKKVLSYIQEALGRLRAGKAHPQLVEHIKVQYHNESVPMKQLAAIGSLQVHTLQIKPWDKTLIPNIEKAIMQSDLGITPQNNGEAVLLHIPAPSEERRRQLLKMCKQEIEQGRIRLRNIRRETNDGLKKNKDITEDMRKSANNRVQKLIEDMSQRMDALYEEKEKEILSI